MNNTLHHFYIKWLRTATIIIGFLAALVASHAPLFLVRVVVSGTVLGGLFLAAEGLIRKKVWRLPFFHQNLDFAGEWKCVTIYEATKTQIADGSCPSETYAYHEALIEQDARHIRIRSSYGREYREWKSIMMELTDDGVAYAYSVDYTDNNEAGLQGTSKGYEELAVKQREPDAEGGKPILLCGTFAHCAYGQSNPRHGMAVFCRAGNIETIVIKDTMAPRIQEAIKVIKNEKNHA